MAKLSIITLLSSFFIVSSLLPLAHSQSQVTNIRFYIQEQFNISNLAYGDVYAIQDPLTVGPDPNSTLLGRVQGTVAFTDPESFADVHMSIAYIFTSGMYNGSTVVAVGRNDATQAFRQFSIVGGTGAFSLAHGIVTSTTYSTDPIIYIADLEIIQEHVLLELK